MVSEIYAFIPEEFENMLYQVLGSITATLCNPLEIILKSVSVS